MYGAIFIIRSCFCMPPGTLSFRSPLSNIYRNGTLSILNWEARFWLASIFNLPTLTLPLDSTPNWSIIGATAPQLGHQGAQANISTGRGDFNTFSSKFASVTMIGWHPVHRILKLSSGRALCSSVFSSSWHFPHFAVMPIRLAGIRFPAPHPGHLIMYDSACVIRLCAPNSHKNFFL